MLTNGHELFFRMTHALRPLSRCCRLDSSIWKTPNYVWKRNAQQKADNSELLDLKPGELPPLHLWRRYFPVKGTDGTKQRVSVSNPETALKLVDAFIPKDAKEKVVVEAFPGPGVLTRALLTLPPSRLRKLIVLEHHEPYLKFLKPLEQLDDRIQVIPLSGFQWTTYSQLEDMGVIDTPRMPWDSGVHPHLHFISHLQSNVMGEQLISQFFRLIPDKQWLFKYGRVPLSFILSEYVWTRIHPPTINTQCKLSVIGQAVAKCEQALPIDETNPFEHHFFPVPIGRMGDKAAATLSSDHKSPNRRVGNPFTAINAVPYTDQIIQPGLLEKWDYCIRRLYVQKATSLRKCINLLGPGANRLCDDLEDPSKPPSERVDLTKQPRHLTVQEWSAVVQAFHSWPFAPENINIDFSGE